MSRDERDATAPDAAARAGLEPGSAAARTYAALLAFLRDRVLPALPRYQEQRRAAGGHAPPPVVAELSAEARALGLWNLFLPSVSGLSLTQYAPMAELTGHAIRLAPQVVNCDAPDSGNMELLHLFGTPAQRERWLTPLLDARIRSGFAMTEPGTASSDATGITTEVAHDGPMLVLRGTKWWVSGALDPRCAVLLVLARDTSTAWRGRHERHSVVLVPTDAAGVSVRRDLPVFGRHDQHGHAEIELRDVRVPRDHLLGEPGAGFAMAQARLGPGRVHHAMRAVGMAERALRLAAARAGTRSPFGRPLAEQPVVRQQLAEARLAVDATRALVLHAARRIEEAGARGAAAEIAAIKVLAPRTACRVIDTAVQLHGAAGVSDDTPLADMWAAARAMRIADGPDEVHLRTLGRTVLTDPDPLAPAEPGAVA